MDENHELKLDLVLEKLYQIEDPSKSVLILHTSAHNPTGVDPTKEQWRKIKKVCYERGILPVFDCAYQVNKLDDMSVF
jgi:aspartate/tyrosine/aromatic aminotransferase